MLNTNRGWTRCGSNFLSFAASLHSCVSVTKQHGACYIHSVHSERIPLFLRLSAADAKWSQFLCKIWCGSDSGQQGHVAQRTTLFSTAVCLFSTYDSHFDGFYDRDSGSLGKWRIQTLANKMLFAFQPCVAMTS